MYLVRLQAVVVGDFLDNIYNVLIALVCGFSSISILGLATRRGDSHRGLNFGEILAVTGAVVAVFLWAWEMLHVFHVLPIRLRP